MGIEKRLCWLMSASTLSRICLLVREFAVQNCIGECIQVRICHFHKLNSILNSFRRYRKSEAQKGVNIDLREGPCPPTHSPMGPTLLQKVEFLVFYCIFFIIIYLILSSKKIFKEIIIWFMKKYMYFKIILNKWK